MSMAEKNNTGLSKVWEKRATITKSLISVLQQYRDRFDEYTVMAERTCDDFRTCYNMIDSKVPDQADVILSAFSTLTKGAKTIIDVLLHGMIQAMLSFVGHLLVHIERDMLSVIVSIVQTCDTYANGPNMKAVTKRILAVMKICSPSRELQSGTPGYRVRDYALLRALKDWSEKKEIEFSAGPWGTSQTFRHLAEL